MFELTQRKNGFVLKLEDMVDIDQLRDIQFQLRDEWAGLNSGFCLLVDARSFRVFTAEAQALFEDLLEEAREHGLQRISVLGVSTGLAMIFCNSMVRTDLMPVYQFMDTAYEPNWSQEVEEWLNAPFEEEA